MGDSGTGSQKASLVPEARACVGAASQDAENQDRLAKIEIRIKSVCLKYWTMRFPFCQGVPDNLEHAVPLSSLWAENV